MAELYLDDELACLLLATLPMSLYCFICNFSATTRFDMVVLHGGLLRTMEFAIRQLIE